MFEAGLINTTQESTTFWNKRWWLQEMLKFRTQPLIGKLMSNSATRTLKQGRSRDRYTWRWLEYQVLPFTGTNLTKFPITPVWKTKLENLGRIPLCYIMSRLAKHIHTNRCTAVRQLGWKIFISLDMLSNVLARHFSVLLRAQEQKENFLSVFNFKSNFPFIRDCVLIILHTGLILITSLSTLALFLLPHFPRPNK